MPGAVLSLTVKSIGLHNAPVMGTDGQQALDNGVVHVPETSLPWTRSSHRNVYLAGHRLGWPDTGSRLIFYNLNQLQPGDEVVLRDRRRTNRYGAPFHRRTRNADFSAETRLSTGPARRKANSPT